MGFRSGVLWLFMCASGFRQPLAGNSVFFVEQVRILLRRLFLLISPSFHITVVDTSAAIAEIGPIIESRRVFFYY